MAVRSLADIRRRSLGDDSTRRITVEPRADMFDLKETVNGMMESLSL